MKILKSTLWALLILVVLAIVGIVVLFALIDPNDYKSQLTQLVKEKKHRTLRLEGSLKLSLFPSLGIDLGRASLSEFNSDDTFASVESVKVAVELLPLLQHRLKIHRIELAGMQAHLLRHKNGSTNIDDLLNQDDTETSQIEFDIEGVDIQKTKLLLEDEMTRSKIELNNLNLKTGRVVDKKPFAFALHTGFSINQKQTQGELHFDGQVYFDKLAKLAKISTLDFNLQHLNVGNQLHDAQFELKSKELAVDVLRKTMVVEALDAEFNQQQGAHPVKAKFKLPKLIASPEKIESSSIEGNFVLSGSSSAVLKLELKDIAGTLNGVVIKSFNIEAQHQEGERKLVMTLRAPFTLNVENQTIHMPQFNVAANIADAALAHKEIKASGRGEVKVDLRQQKIVSQFISQIEDATLQAKLSVNSFEQPQLNFDIRAEKIDVDRLLPNKNPSQPTGTVSKKVVEAERPIDLSALKPLNLDGHLQVGYLVAHGIKLSQLNTKLHAANGVMHLSNIEADLYRGSLKGSATIDANTNRYNVQQSLNNIDIKALLVDAMQQDFLEGRGNLNFDVTAQGQLVSRLKKSLNGQATIALRDGAYKGINLAKSLRDIQSKLSGRKNEVQTSNQTEKTDFSEITASFKIINGVAHNNDLNGKSPFLRFSGSGDIDLGESQLNYVLKTSVVNTATGQQGKELKQLRDIAVPVRIFGPFDNIRYDLQWSQLSSEALKNLVQPQLEEKKKELQEKARTQLKDELNKQLKGLFK